MWASNIQRTNADTFVAKSFFGYGIYGLDSEVIQIERSVTGIMATWVGRAPQNVRHTR